MFQTIISVEKALHKFPLVFSGASLVIPTVVMTLKELKYILLNNFCGGLGRPQFTGAVL